MLPRAMLALEGLSVADAFGEQLLHAGPNARRLALDARTAPGGRRWKWTDEPAMAISIVDELRARGSIDANSPAARFAQRYIRDPARGYGRGAHEVLGAIAAGTAIAPSTSCA